MSRSEVERPTTRRCTACYLHSTLCACAMWVPHPCSIEVIIVRHAVEAHRVSNTGRIVAANLAGSRILSYGARFAAPAPAIDTLGAALLWPGPASPAPALVRRLVVLDGTWPQARRMRQRIPWLRGLPLLSLGAIAPRPRLRRARTAGELSTAEAVSEALRVLGEERAARHLDRRVRDVIRRLSIPARSPFDARTLPGSESR